MSRTIGSVIPMKKPKCRCCGKEDSTFFNLGRVKRICIKCHKELKAKNGEIRDVKRYSKQIYIDGTWVEMENLTGADISLLLIQKPKLIERLDLSKLNDWDIRYLVREKPEFEKYFPGVEFEFYT